MLIYWNVRIEQNVNFDKCFDSYSYLFLCNKLNSTRVSISCYLWPIGGQRDKWTITFFTAFFCAKQIDSMLPYFRSVIDHRWRQNVLEHHWHTRLMCATFLFSPHVLDVICDVFLNRRTATLNLLVNCILTSNRSCYDLLVVNHFLTFSVLFGGFDNHNKNVTIADD